MMRRIVEFAISHARLTLAVLAFLLIAGILAYVTHSEGSDAGHRNPDHLRISCRSAASRRRTPSGCWSGRWKPQLKTVANVKKMRAAAFEGGGYVLLEFEAGFNSDVALQDVRAKVDDAKPDLPADADEPSVSEVNLSLLPVIVVTLSGDLSERTLGTLARDAERTIEQVPGVLSADVQGTRDEVVEIIAEPMLLKSYGVDAQANWRPPRHRATAWSRPARSRGRQGRFAVKVPALIETPEDVLNIPVAASQRGVGHARRRRRGRARPSRTRPPITRVNGQSGRRHRGGQARRRQPHRDRRRRQGGGRATAEVAGRQSVHVNFIQDQSKHDPAAAQRPAEQRRHRGPAGRRDHPLHPRRPRLDLHRHRDSDLVPDRHPRAFNVRADAQHRRPVQPDPRRRHAGRRRDHRRPNSPSGG